MMNAGDLAKAKEWVRTQVGPERFRHIRGVARTSIRLARRHGLSSEKAEWAAWLHDCAKEWTRAEMLSWIRRAGFRMDRSERALPALWHPHAGAAAARLKWGIRDRDLLEAIRCHTLGGPGMGPLAQAVFVADFIEPGRDFRGVVEARKAVRSGLRAGVRAKASLTLGFLLSKNVKIHPRLLETWNSF
jgi:predicted HD superfamily hydrolase involved in NAD metabolism